LLRVAQQRIRVVPNGLDVDRFLKLEVTTQELIGKLQLMSAAPLMLLPVRITLRKNIELALRVLAVLREQYAQARLLVTGPLGPHNPANTAYFERLLGLRTELHLEGAAHFLAEIAEQTVPDEVIADLYKLADLLLLPSREEGFGIPVLEAGLAGIPVFCSDISALHQLAAADAHYFPPDGQPAEIAGEIARVLASSPTYALRKRVLGEYTWEPIYRNSIAPLLAKG
jgi:glycosyltransferase involved in cell wall biosynthesis